MKYTAVVLLCLFQLAYSWPTCETESFCNEIRNSQTPTNFVIDAATFAYENNQVTVDVIDEDDGRSLKLSVASVNDGVFRITIDDPENHRHDVPEALDGLPTSNALLISDAVTYLEIANGENSLRLHYNPIKFEVYKNSQLIVVINENGKLNFNSREDNQAISVDVRFLETLTAYGIPSHAERLSLKNTKIDGRNPYRLYNADYCCWPISTQEGLYGSVPVLYAHGTQRTSGVFWLNSGQTFVDIDYTDNEVQTLFVSETGVLDMFVLTGPTLADSIKQYSKLTGIAPLPPLFALGHHQARWSYMSQEDALTVVREFDNHDFPLDVLWLDIDYTDSYKYFTWNLETFPNPIGMQNEIASTGRKLVLIIDPHVKIEEGYFVFDTASANGYFVKGADGNDFEGNCWPGLSSWWDFFNPEASSYYTSLFTTFANTTDIVHIWNDMNEPAVFDIEDWTMPRDNRHYGGWLHKEVHNIYGLTQHRATRQGLLDRYDNQKRPFVLTRAHFSGSQRYTAVWTGDNIATWDHLKISIPMCLNLAISGISFCGADVGGFENEGTDELFQRWYQTGAWLPFYRAHSSLNVERREPYLPRYSEEVQSRFRNAMRERYYHLPLWYTLFYEHERYGDPVIRPLSYHYGSDPNTLSIDDEWLVGENVLVHPVTDEGATSVDVYFPGDNVRWFDIVNNLAYPGGTNQVVDVNMDSIPVFYKSGSILARKETHRASSALTHEDDYTIYVFLNENTYAESNLYFDDFESFDYREKKYNYYRMLYNDIGGLLLYILDQDASYEGTFNVDSIWLYAIPGSGFQVQQAIVDSTEYPVKCAEDGSYCVAKDINLRVGKSANIKFV